MIKTAVRFALLIDIHTYIAHTDDSILQLDAVLNLLAQRHRFACMPRSRKATGGGTGWMAAAEERLQEQEKEAQPALPPSHQRRSRLDDNDDEDESVPAPSSAEIEASLEELSAALASEAKAVDRRGGVGDEQRKMETVAAVARTRSRAADGTFLTGLAPTEEEDDAPHERYPNYSFEVALKNQERPVGGSRGGDEDDGGGVDSQTAAEGDDSAIPISLQGRRKYDVARVGKTVVEAPAAARRVAPPSASSHSRSARPAPRSNHHPGQYTTP